MAINVICSQCKKGFTTSLRGSSALCDNCSGVNEAKQKEKERWASLSSEQKIEELANREGKTRWNIDPLIG